MVFQFSAFDDEKDFQFAGFQYVASETVFVPGFFCQLEVSILDSLRVSIVTILFLHNLMTIQRCVMIKSFALLKMELLYAAQEFFLGR